MRAAKGIRHRGMVAVAVLASVLTAASCGTGSDATGSRASGFAEAADSGGKNAAPRASKGSLTWEFEHIAGVNGELTDIAVLASDDIWAVGTRFDHDRNAAHLLHYDGRQWKREPLPEALGAGLHPPLLEEIGEEALWLRPRTAEDATAANRWAQWDGTRWSAVPNPPPGNPGDFEAAGPNDIWAQSDERTAEHWDGTRWTSTRLPYDTSDLAVVGPGDVWAVGRRSTGPGTELGDDQSYSQPASTHWDGTSWKSVRTPQARFEKPLPPEPSAGLLQVIALGTGEVRAYGVHTFNHGEVENEPADQSVRLRWDGSQWVKQEPAPGGCARRTPVGSEGKALFLNGNWYMTDDGRCVKIKRHRLPLQTGARKGSNQSLWLKEIHRVPGTDEWVGAGHVQVNQSGDPFRAPVVVRLKRGG
ncbi:hypothetical protein [Streptomyces chryseus]|uniref:hypothetical protein n=1 Tax=Streptomyces chryseus TaxID=68186 RepID=UPI00110F77F4|nr:hypothetical protein [Streptomyces chryseus]GGX37199.1 hypothetical protein GCM10010353_60470 [Streptomyces chryseus]